MDNMMQIEEITRYREHLVEMVGMNVDYEAAAMIWIKNYAKMWRSTHPMPEAFADGARLGGMACQV